MLPRILNVCLLCTMVLASCSSTKENKDVATSTVLSNQDLLKEGTTDVIGNVFKGEAVEFLTMSFDSSMIKIKAAAGDGWVRRYAVATTGVPGTVTQEARVYHTQDSTLEFMSVAVGAIVTVDTTSSPWWKATFVGPNKQETGWVMKRSISTDVKDVLFVTSNERLIQSISSMPAEQRSEAYSKFLSDNADNKMVTVIPVRLSEATDEAIGKINSFDAFADKGGNRIITTYRNAEKRLIAFINDLYQNKDYNDEINPRYSYFTLFVSQLPDFVKIGPRYQFADSLGFDQSIRSFAFFRIDRSAKNIEVLYKKFRSPILAALSEADAETTASLLDKLIAAHDHIVGLHDYQTLCKKIARQIAERDKRTGKFVIEIAEQAEIYDPILDTKIMERYLGPEGPNAGLWFHSFWVRRLSEGNADVVYTILKDLAQENRKFFKTLENTMDDGYTGDSSEERELTCVLQGAGLGDCVHINFTCGDFGYADISLLNDAQRELWKALTVPAEADDVAANPEYLGRTFRIVMREVQGEACNEGQGGMGVIQQIVSIEVEK